MPHEVSFGAYIYATLKDLHSETGMTKGAMKTMNSFVNLLALKLAQNSLEKAQMADRQTIQSKDIMIAAQQVFPGEMAKHARSEIQKATQKYQQSKA